MIEAINDLFTIADPDHRWHNAVLRSGDGRDLQQQGRGGNVTQEPPPQQVDLDEMPGMEHWGHAEIQTPPALIPSRPAP